MIMLDMQNCLWMWNPDLKQDEENNHGERLNYIADEFGPISGIARGSIAKVLTMTTLSGTEALDGRSISKKSKAAMADCRFLLAY